MQKELKEEDNKSNNESDYIIFHLKHNNSFLKKNPQESNQNIISANHKLENSPSIKDINTNINKNNEKNIKNPFTNLILREKINSFKFNKFLNNRVKPKIKLDNKNNNSTREFLIINKYETIIPKNHNNKYINEDNNKTIYNNGIRNIKKNFNKNSKLILKKNNIAEKIKKVSTGQQTFMDMNFINNFKNVDFNYNYNYNNKTINNNNKTINNNNKTINNNNNIKNIPIKNKLNFDFTKNKNININIKNNNYNNIIENTPNTSALLYVPNQTIKKNNENDINIINDNNNNNNININNINNISNINNIINHEYLNNSKDIFDSLSRNEISYATGNNSQLKRNKTQRLIKNKSNIVSFDEIHIDEKKNSMSIRELYRQMIANKEKKIKNINLS